MFLLLDKSSKFFHDIRNVLYLNPEITLSIFVKEIIGGLVPHEDTICNPGPVYMNLQCKKGAVQSGKRRRYPTSAASIRYHLLSLSQLSETDLR